MKRKLIAGFMALCAVAMTLNTTSCGKLEDGIKDLQEQVSGLEQKIADLENKLNSQVAEINNAIRAAEAKIAVVAVDKKDGDVTFTLADGSKITLTIVEVDHATGEIFLQGVSTGILVSQLEELSTPIVTGFEEGDDYVVFQIGDETYTLPKYNDETASLVLGRTDFFLMYGGTKTVELTAEGIAEYYVMSKPDGWKANLDGTTLTVIAPSAELTAIGAAEAEGQVLVHATTAAGKCMVAKLDVKTGFGLTVQVDNDGNVEIHNAYAGLVVNQWMGTESYQFIDFAYGFADPATFNADPEAYIASVNDYSCWDPMGYFYNNIEMGTYVEGEYEVDIINTTLAEAYFPLAWSDLDPSYRFVFWVAPVDDMGYVDVNGLQYVQSPATIKAEFIEATHNDVKIRLTTYGADCYILGKVNESYYNNEWSPMTFEEYMTSAMGGPWTGFVQWGMPEALGVANENHGEVELWLSEIVMYEGEEPAKLLYGEKYKLWVFPASYDKNPSDYSFNEDFMPYVFEFSTNDIVAGGNYDVTFGEPEATYTSVAVEIEPAEGAETTYYNFYTPEEYAAFEEDEDAIRNDLILNCYYPITETEVVVKEYANPDERYILAAVTVGTDGKYGDVATVSVSTKTISYNENITVSVESVTADADGNHTVVFNVTGADYLCTYYIGSGEYTENVIMTTVKNGAEFYAYGYQFAEVVDGKATVTFEANSYKTHFYGCAYNIVNGAVSEVGATTVVGAFADYLN